MMMTMMMMMSALYYTITLCFFDNHSALNSQSNDWLDWNQNDVSEWSDMSTRRLSFQ
jgi:hypothetical protein